MYSTWRDQDAIPYLKEKQGIPPESEYAYCQKCGRTGIPHYTAPVHMVIDVDHIVSRSSDKSRERDLLNVQFLCRTCHMQKTSLEARRDFDNRKFLAGEYDEKQISVL